jgi:NAD(P)-dependent dehydrogenase (short-subunit alcohol dehydrogenase family)
MRGKIVLITGANRGIGRETTRGLARMGATIVMACRDLTKANPVGEVTKRETGNGQIEVMQLDVASLGSIREFVVRFGEKYSKLDVLINNAGILCGGRQETEDGFNRVMATNYLGPFLLTNLLLPALKQAGEARIISVSSIAHLWGGSDLSDLNFKKRWVSTGPYASSKLAIILFIQELAERLKGTNITANTLHPGVVATNIYRIGPLDSWYQALFIRISRLVLISPTEGAQTSIYLASSDDVKGVTGKYFYKRNPGYVSPKCRDMKLQKGLWQLSQELTGLSAASHS